MSTLQFLGLVTVSIAHNCNDMGTSCIGAETEPSTTENHNLILWHVPGQMCLMYENRRERCAALVHVARATRILFPSRDYQLHAPLKRLSAKIELGMTDYVMRQYHIIILFV